MRAKGNLSTSKNKINFIMALSAEQILTSHKNTQLHSTKPNFTTIDFHKGRNSAGFYRNLIDSHLFSHQLENHTLSSATRQYQAQTKKKYRTKSLSKKGDKNQNPEMGNSESLGKLKVSSKQPVNDDLYRKIFEKKTEKVPQIENELYHELDEKLRLEKRIADLKSAIAGQKKAKTKTSLNSNKIMNEIEKVQKKTQTVREQNYHLGVKIDQIAIQIGDTMNQLDLVVTKLNLAKKRVSQNEKVRNQLRKYIQDAHVSLREQKKHFNCLKGMQMKAIHNMQNNYMYENQLKEEKALLLVAIDDNYHKNA